MSYKELRDLGIERMMKLYCDLTKEIEELKEEKYYLLELNCGDYELERLEVIDNTIELARELMAKIEYIYEQDER